MRPREPENGPTTYHSIYAHSTNEHVLCQRIARHMSATLSNLLSSESVRVRDVHARLVREHARVVRGTTDKMYVHTRREQTLHAPHTHATYAYTSMHITYQHKWSCRQPRKVRSRLPCAHWPCEETNEDVEEEEETPHANKDEEDAPRTHPPRCALFRLRLHSQAGRVVMITEGARTGFWGSMVKGTPHSAQHKRLRQ